MTKPTLLYAEDDLESRENCAFILKEYFSDIYLAQNGQEALSLYHEKHPDILLLDISMPLINGLDLVKTIRKDDPDTLAIMLSAHADREKLLSAVSLKLEAYLLKPVDDILLKDTIVKAIKQIQAKGSLYLRKDLIWDREHSLLIYKGKELKLTKKEHLLMQLLTHSLGMYISHDELIIHIWHDEIPDHTHDNKLIQLIYRFNKKIMERLSSPSHLIENSYTLGYKLTCK